MRRVRAGEKPGKPKKKKPREETTEKKKDRSPEKNVSRDRDKENKVQKENKKNSQSPNKTPSKGSNKSPTKTPTKRSPKASPKTPKRESPSPPPDIMAGLTNGTNGIDSDGGIHLPEAESEAVLAEKEEVGILTSPINVPSHELSTVPIICMVTCSGGPGGDELRPNQGGGAIPTTNLNGTIATKDVRRSEADEGKEESGTIAREFRGGTKGEHPPLMKSSS